MKLLSSILVLAAIAGTSTAESTCCNANQSKGCDAASAFPVKIMSFTMNDIPLVTCCGTADGYVDNVDGNPTCAGSDIPSAPAPAPVEPSTPTVTGDTESPTSESPTSTPAESTCCNAPESKGCDAASAFPVKVNMSFSVNDIPLVTCCKGVDGQVNNVNDNPACAGSDTTTTTTTTESTPSPTPSAGFASSTSVAIGASVAFLAMIFV